MVFQHSAAELVALDMEDVVPSHPLRGKIKATDAGEETCVIHSFGVIHTSV
tara:strand:+ start:1120 stop:1272 length:153 start_codon:yes stop_codon:yes gene_type:complete